MTERPARETYLAFAPKKTVAAGQCEVAGCADKTLDVYPLVRHMCPSHVIAFLGHEFVGCGCGPWPCPACDRYIESGLRVVVVGERENGPRHAVTDEAMVEALTTPWPGWQSPQMSARYNVRNFHRRRQGFSWGTSRKRLIDLGVRWHMAVNLLGSSPKVGEWNAKVARQVAVAIAPHLALAADRVVLLGSSVATAFDGLPGNFVTIGHPSGNNRQWKEPAMVLRAKEAIDKMYEVICE